MSKNLVNGDSLKKYHVGVNTPHVSEELINENVTSFKVGTSNVTGIDLTNQMEQSFVTLDNIKGNSEIIDYKIKSVVIENDFNTFEFRSVPSGIHDTLKNNIYTQNVGFVNTSNPTNYSIYEFTTSSDGSYGRLTVDLENCATLTENDIFCNVVNIIDYNLTPSEWNTPTKNSIIINISPSSPNRIAFILSGTTTMASAINAIQNSNPRELCYKLKTPKVENINLSYMCNPNDIIDTKSPIPFTCSHTVQLNTKSQVEEAQKQIAKSNKNIWQKFKELTDVEMKLEQDGYIKLPTVLGGLILQWGKLDVKFENTWSKVGTFTPPIELTNLYFANSSVVNCNNGDPIYGTSTFVINNDSDLSKLKYSIIDSRKTNQTLTYSMNWLVIGK